MLFLSMSNSCIGKVGYCYLLAKSIVKLLFGILDHGQNGNVIAY